MNNCDQECLARGIPVYLHQNGRAAFGFNDPEERLYRRFKNPSKLTDAISFERKNSSSNRSSLCLGGANDVLFNTEKGGGYPGEGVISFPALALEGKKFISSEPAEFEIKVIHQPERCNYAHSDFLIMKNGKEVTQIKPATVKLQIREMLDPHIVEAVSI